MVVMASITYSLSYSDNWIDLDRHAGGVTTIAKFNRREVTPERARRLAVMLLGEAAVINDDLAATENDRDYEARFEGWLAETVTGFEAERNRARLKAVLEAAESAAYSWLTAGFSEESNLDIELTGWQPDPDADEYDLQYLVKVDLRDQDGGVSSEVFLVQADAPSGWYGEYHCEAGGFEPESWKQVL